LASIHSSRKPDAQPARGELDVLVVALAAIGGGLKLGQ
jgi:hypothetical protein